MKQLLIFCWCKDSANRMQSSSLVIAEVQPVLVFEDKDREFLDQFQEIAPILLQLVWTNAPTLDKSQKSIQNLSKRADK